MKRVPSRWLLIGGVVGIVLASCGASTQSIAEYTEAIEDATTAYIDESQALAVAFNQSVEEEVAAIIEKGEGDLLEQAVAATSQETVQYLALLEDAMTRYMNNLEAMQPPRDVTEAHDDYMAALDSVRSAMPATRDGVSDAEGLDAIEAAITASGFGDGQLRLRAACDALVVAVSDLGEHVDLGCSVPEGPVQPAPTP